MHDVGMSRGTCAHCCIPISELVFPVLFLQSLYVPFVMQTFFIQKAAIATLPLTMYPQQSEEPHTFTYKSTLELIHAPITSLE